MKMMEAIELARQGQPIRRAAWPYNKTLAFSAGRGELAAVAVVTTGSAIAVMRASDVPSADRVATDWGVAG